MTPKDFITRWQSSGGHERGSGQMFVTELCDLLELPHPDPPKPETAHNDYVFERAIPRLKKDGTQTTVFADLYKAGHLLLETKQGVNPARTKDDPSQLLLKNADLPVAEKKAAKGHGTRDTHAWDKALDKAYEQARLYIRDLPAEDGIPPFLIVCDVGYVFEIYADFSGTRGTYAPFPVAGQHRIYLQDLADEEKRALLRTIFSDPHSLDPSKHAAKVTRQVSAVLADLAKSLEAQKHHPELIALFLQRTLFTLFAEDVGLLPEKSFEHLLGRLKDNEKAFPTFVTNLWKEMAEGTEFSQVISGEKIVKIPHFNGGLFENPTALPLDGQQITLLLHAAKQDWSDVEPAIFGTLLERALDPRDRHKLGAHYTPRSYVERLVEPTLLQPLREQWNAAKVAAASHHAEAILSEEDAQRSRDIAVPENKTKATAFAKKIKTAEDKARKERLAATKSLTDFHHLLCQTKVLDPACGSGNFLYVAMAKMKELEAEVLDLLAEIAPQETLTMELKDFKVRPDQFLGLEINERATAIAQLVLWIGHFQWHKKATGKADTNDRPLLPKQSTIECRDAVLAYDQKIPLKDEDGNFVTIWDGHTTKPNPVTGEEIPDETARKPIFTYENPRRTEWPEADYIVGNPPFLGNKRMRDGLGDGYAEALRLAFKKHKPNSWDFVMFWWHQAAELLQAQKIQQFGFITTNSIHQTFNRRCLEPFLNHNKKPLSLTFAIPDHPWIDSTDGAAVRISMTSATYGGHVGSLVTVIDETEIEEGEHLIKSKLTEGTLTPSLNTGVPKKTIRALQSNHRLTNRGMTLVGKGFILSPSEANEYRDKGEGDYIKRFYTGRDLAQRETERHVIDFYGLSEADAFSKAPHLYQHLKTHVFPDRQQNNRISYREKWWVFAEPRNQYRPAIERLAHHVLSPRTARHRYFLPHPTAALGESEVILIALENPFYLGVISSNIHITWSLFLGGRLGVGNDPRYSIDCFETFPFPDLPDDSELKTRISDLGERLDAHRKARQAEHPHLTLTGMYNVLEKLCKEEPLTDKDKVIHDQGLITLLKQLHDDLDTAVLQAYRGGAFQAPSPSYQALARRIESAATPLADRLSKGDEELEQAILQFLVDLNHERAAEEANGQIRYLRPEFQDPDYGKKVAQKQQAKLDLPEAKPSGRLGEASLPNKLPWPKPTTDRIATLKTLLQTLPPDPTALSPALKGNNTPKRREEIQDLLQALASLGQI